MQYSRYSPILFWKKYQFFGGYPAKGVCNSVNFFQTLLSPNFMISRISSENLVKFRLQLFFANEPQGFFENRRFIFLRVNFRNFRNQNIPFFIDFLRFLETDQEKNILLQNFQNIGRWRDPLIRNWGAPFCGDTLWCVKIFI